MPSEMQALMARSGHPCKMPGGWQAAVITALSALLAGFGAISARNQSSATSDADVSRISEVTAEDLPAALTTIAASFQQLAHLSEREQCGPKLAWVTLASASGQAVGRIRLQSGSYLSPAFEITNVPVRVALPYPAPYATGRGIILIVGTTTKAVVALTPPWIAEAQAGVEVRKVNWTPNIKCLGEGK